MSESTATRREAAAKIARDQIGHWVSPAGARDRPCPHKCCQGRRVHPDKLPVTLDRGYLRELSGEQLGAELASYVNYADKRSGALTEITAEIERRGDPAADAVERGYNSKVSAESAAEARAARSRASSRDKQKRRTEEWRDEVYREWLAAESETNGYMLNKEGKRRGIDERSLFTGSQARVDRYASDELKDYFAAHPRPTRERILGRGSERRHRMQRGMFGQGPGEF